MRVEALGPAAALRLLRLLPVAAGEKDPAVVAEMKAEEKKAAGKKVSRELPRWPLC
jgi:hypothetical protein